MEKDKARKENGGCRGRALRYLTGWPGEASLQRWRLNIMLREAGEQAAGLPGGKAFRTERREYAKAPCRDPAWHAHGKQSWNRISEGEESLWERRSKS